MAHGQSITLSKQMEAGMDKRILLVAGGCTALAVILSSCSSPTNQAISAAELPNQSGQPVLPPSSPPVPATASQVTGVVNVAPPPTQAIQAQPQSPQFDSNQQPIPPGQPQGQPSIQGQDPRMALADKLASLNAVMYKTGWCPKCKEQEAMFGQEAFSKIKTIDCEKDVDICADKGVRSYPTWELNGQKLEPGMYPLQDLARMAGLDPSPYQDGSPSRMDGEGGMGRSMGRPRRGGMM